MRAATHRVTSLHVGMPLTLGTEGADDPMDRPWRTGIFKGVAEGPTWLGRTNLQGDGQGDLVRHGGPDKAVCVYPAIHYPFWREVLSIPDLPYAAFGENFTVEAVAEPDVCIGDVFDIGSARVQVTQPRQPCWRVARRWRMKDLAARMQEAGNTGWYLRVLEEGWVEVGQSLTLHERPHPEWTIARANQVMHHDRGSARQFAACAALSASWRKTLALRARTGESPDPHRRLIGANESPVAPGTSPPG